MPGSDSKHELVYDWNTVGKTTPYPAVVEIDDETLRDGLQSPSATNPTTEQKLELLHLMADLGIQGADIGLPAAGPAVTADAVRLAQEIANCNLNIIPNCAGRTLEADILPMLEVSEKAGFAVEASLFIGSSPIRQFVENWKIDKMVQLAEKAVAFAVDHGLPVMFVTEDTTRADPESVRKLYTAAINAGAKRLCIADTTGYATPDGVRALIAHLHDIIADTGATDVTLDWHGHNDRGMAVINALVAVDAGVTRIHGTALGVGERTGNSPVELLLVNLRMMGYIDNDLSKLPEYCRLASEYCGVPIYFNQPVIGHDAFRTCTGVHAAAVIKAMKKGDDRLANRVYSSVPADWIHRRQLIEIGPVSGASNVIYWLEERGYRTDPDLVEAILDSAKQSNAVLTTDQIEAIIHTVKT